MQPLLTVFSSVTNLSTFLQRRSQAYRAFSVVSRTSIKEKSVIKTVKQTREHRRGKRRTKMEKKKGGWGDGGEEKIAQCKEKLT